MSEHNESDSVATERTAPDAADADAEGDAADAGSGAAPAAPAAAAGPARTTAAPASGGFGPLALLALVIAAAAAAGTGFLWWQYRQFYLVLDTADSQQRATLESLVVEQSELDRLLDALRQQMTEDRNRIVDVRAEMSDFPQQFAVLERRLDALQGRSLDARDVWLRAESEYYLVVANTELTLAGRVEHAITALTLADGLLRELGDPALNAVRVTIADELTRLRAVPLVDHEGLAFSLASLASRLPELPFRAAGATRFDGEPTALDGVEPGVGRLWQSLKQAVLGIVRIERRDAPVDQLLSAAERDLVIRQLVLELQLARIALLRSESDAFRASLVAAEELLNAEFDTSSAGVAGALELLGELRRLDIAPTLPDLSGSLRLLRAAAPAGDGR